MRNVNMRASKTSRVFPEVSASRDSPLVLVEAPSQGLSFPLILARIKCSLVVALLHSEAVDTEPRTMPSQEPSPGASHNFLGSFTSGSAFRSARRSRSPRVTSKVFAWRIPRKGSLFSRRLILCSLFRWCGFVAQDEPYVCIRVVRCQRLQMSEWGVLILRRGKN